MIQVGGVTYRIERTAPHNYTVVRLLDDLEVGKFRTLPSLRVTAVSIDLTVFRSVVRTALRSARTSAVMQAAPVCMPSEAEPAANAGGQVPSTVPPRPAVA
jgi:hypothetical protein